MDFVAITDHNNYSVNIMGGGLVMFIRNLKRYLFYRKIFQDNKDRINIMINSLHDEKSQYVIRKLIKARIVSRKSAIAIFNEIKEPECNRIAFELEDGYKVLEKENQYFIKDFFTFKDDEVLFDAGAYVGDTLRDFIISTEGKFSKAYCIEPNMHSFEKLKEYKENSPFSKSIRIFNIALSDIDRNACFITSDAGSRIDMNGTELVQAVNALNFIKDNITPKSTFIKMDIEGYELRVLKNIMEYIVENKPNLAISIYHNMQDLWEIPLLIKRICPDYKIFIRHNSNYYTETICYASIKDNI